MPGQTVQTQISLLVEEQSDQGLHCLPFRLHLWTHYSMVEPHNSNFSVITTNFLGVRIFRKFTVIVTDWAISVDTDKTALCLPLLLHLFGPLMYAKIPDLTV